MEFILNALADVKMMLELAEDSTQLIIMSMIFIRDSRGFNFN